MDPEFGAVYFRNSCTVGQCRTTTEHIHNTNIRYFELPGIFMLPADLRSDNFLNFT